MLLLVPFYSLTAYYYRFIYVAKQDIGTTKSFIEEKGCTAIYNVLRPNSTHEDYLNMTKLKQNWFLNNMR